MDDSTHVRFEQKVLRTDGCWHWLASTNDYGYGKLYYHGRLEYAHRLAYEHWVGPLVPGLVLDHLCRNPGCVNPSHLEQVTEQTNMLRGVGMSAKHAKKTHCPRGHEYSGENVMWQKNGSRQCRECRKIMRRSGLWK